MPVPIIHLENVSFRYNDQIVLKDINLTINKGDYVGVIGPNGSGKTTLLKILLGLLTPQQGNVSLFGQAINTFRDWSKIGYVPQKVGSLVTNFPITVEEVVGMGKLNNNQLFDFVSKEDTDIINTSLEAVHMEKSRKRLMRELSGGQQQRVFIAKALASNPELLILDEPTVGIDTESQTRFYELLKVLNLQHGLTLVIVSHDIDVVAHEVSTIACINRTLVCHGRPKEVFEGNFMDEVYGKALGLVVHGHQ
jgi:zinc transport system ATP-binding protein